jgi:methyl-accepting chemotaxis protein
MSRSRRRQYIINPGFQWKVVLTVSALVFLTSSIISSILYGVLHAQARARFTDPTGYTAEVPLVVVGFGLAFSLVAAVAVALWCILITHRVCGPLSVMAKGLEDLAAGRPPEVRAIRRNDEFKEFHQTFCRALESVTRRRTQALEAISAALSCAATARSGADRERAAQVDTIVQHLQRVRILLCEGGLRE